MCKTYQSNSQNMHYALLNFLTKMIKANIKGQYHQNCLIQFLVGWWLTQALAVKKCIECLIFIIGCFKKPILSDGSSLKISDPTIIFLVN